jgi:hypothetical protein
MNNSQSVTAAPGARAPLLEPEQANRAHDVLESAIQAIFEIQEDVLEIHEDVLVAQAIAMDLDDFPQPENDEVSFT